MEISDVIQGASLIISGAAVITAMFPQTKKASGVLATIRKVLDVLALNVGNARNARK